MIVCGKCKKKVESMESKLLIIDHAYEVTVKCHGETHKMTKSIRELHEMEKAKDPLVLWGQPKKVAAKK